VSLAVSNQSLAELYDLEEGLTVALQGKPHKEIAKALGMCERAYYRLRFTDALFKHAVDRAREEGHEAIADSVLTIVDDNLFLNPQSVKIKLDAIVKWLGWMNPDKYGDRVTVRQELVDLKGALNEAKTRVLDITPKPPIVDPFEE
jgi:hypothetical protein